MQYASSPEEPDENIFQNLKKNSILRLFLPLFPSVSKIGPLSLF